jgi:hypothetical protein
VTGELLLLLLRLPADNETSRDTWWFESMRQHNVAFQQNKAAATVTAESDVGAAEQRLTEL